MTLSDHRGNQYVAHFHYGKFDERRLTHCALHPAPCPDRPAKTPCFNEHQGKGHAACSQRDEFKKATGRKIALARAMADLGLGRAARTALWANYLRLVSR